MKSFLGNHWCHTYRGGEKVLEQLRILFPKAPLYTLFFRRGQIPDSVLGVDVRFSLLNWIPGIERHYRELLIFYPFALRLMKSDLRGGLFICSDASMFKSVNLRNCFHICYCHSPPRYVWEDGLGYLEKSGLRETVKRWVLRKARPMLQNCDRRGADRVNVFVANSRFVAERIMRFYGRDSEIVYPPVAIQRFEPKQSVGDYYLVVSQLVPYKRVDLAIEACNRSRKRLVVVGGGTEFERLCALAGPTVELRGRCSDEEVTLLLQGCRAFIYPQVEDFGITAVEAQACGRPVLALRKGGACETVVAGKTGVFFDQQTVESVCSAITSFEASMLDKNGQLLRPVVSACRENSLRFSEERFRDEMASLIRRHYPAAFESV